jgi:alpha-glucosidase
VGDLPHEVLQDPIAHRSGGAEKGRDGCRVPLPWRAAGPSFGFGEGDAHLPQPDWFGPLSVEAQEADPASTLRMYREALKLRQSLQSAESLTWHETRGAAVLHFERPGGWHCVKNFGSETVSLPAGAVVLASAPLEGDRLPGQTTAWVCVED